MAVSVKRDSFVSALRRLPLGDRVGASEHKQCMWARRSGACGAKAYFLQKANTQYFVVAN